jgi:hypothetical protein
MQPEDNINKDVGGSLREPNQEDELFAMMKNSLHIDDGLIWWTWKESFNVPGACLL